MPSPSYSTVDISIKSALVFIEQEQMPTISPNKSVNIVHHISDLIYQDVTA